MFLLKAFIAQTPVGALNPPPGTHNPSGDDFWLLSSPSHPAGWPKSNPFDPQKAVGLESLLWRSQNSKSLVFVLLRYSARCSSCLSTIVVMTLGGGKLNHFPKVSQRGSDNFFSYSSMMSLAKGWGPVGRKLWDPHESPQSPEPSTRQN